MKEDKQNVIKDYSHLHQLTLIAVNSYLSAGFFATIAKSTHIFLSGIGYREGLFHGRKGKRRAEKLEMYLNTLGSNDKAGLIVLLLAVFSDPNMEGRSKKLVNIIAEQLIQGNEENATLKSDVFSEQAINKVLEDKNNFTNIIIEENITNFDKGKGARALLLQAIQQPDFKPNLTSLMGLVNIIRSILDSPDKPINLRILPKSPAVEARYAEVSVTTALEGKGLPNDILYRVSFFLSRRDLAQGLTSTNRLTFKQSQEVLTKTTPMPGLI